MFTFDFYLLVLIFSYLIFLIFFCFGWHKMKKDQCYFDDYESNVGDGEL